MAGRESSVNSTLKTTNLRCFAIDLIHSFYPADVNLYEDSFSTTFSNELLGKTC